MTDHFEVKRSTSTLPIPREMLLDVGAIEPTPAERADRERRRAEYERSEAEHKARLDAFREALASITDPLARAVLDLHCEDAHGDCRGDEFAGYEGEPPRWPCETVEVIAKYCGIQLRGES